MIPSGLQNWFRARVGHVRGWVALMQADRWLLALYCLLTLLLVASDGVGISLLFPIVTAMSGDASLSGVPLIGFVNRLFHGWSTSSVLMATTLLLMILVGLRSGVLYALQLVSTLIPLRVQRRLSLAALDDLLACEWSYISQFNAGQLQHRAMGLPHEISAMLTDLAELATNFILLCAYCVLMLLIDLRSAVLGTLLVGSVTLALKSFGRGPLRRLGEETNLLLQRTGLEVMQFLEGFRQILISGGERRSRERLGGLYDAYYRVQKRRGIVLMLPGPAFTFASGIIICLLLIGNLTLNAGPPAAWLGRFLIFLFVFNRLSAPVGALNQAWLRLIARVPSYDLFTGFIAGLRHHRRQRGSLPFASLRSGIHFEDVTFCYPGHSAKPALRGVTASIAKGETVALVGPSGSGKSTFAMLISGLYQPTSGRILVDGVDVDALDWDQWHRRLGFVFQDAFIFDDSVRRNIEFPFDDVKLNVVTRAAQEAQADEFIRILPEGYETRVGIRGERLSGGQRQRVSIARTVLRDPDVLILDEAASNLDTLSEAALHRALVRHKGEKTIIHIAHRLGMIREVDRILVFDAGAIVAQGTHDELLGTCPLYAELIARSAFTESVDRAADAPELMKTGA